MRSIVPAAVLIASICLYSLLVPQVFKNREEVRVSLPAGYVIPSKFSRVLAVGNKGVLSDFLFLKLATFIGTRSNEKKILDDDDWAYVESSLDVITELDPHFVDPYFLAEGLLAWDAQRPDSANKVLLRGTEYRKNDWRLHFFIGFNYFYFLQNYENASNFIMNASRLPGSPGYLATLAARLSYYGGKSKTALLFLQEMLAETDDVLLRMRLQKRLLALERAVVIEDAVNIFKRKYGRDPVKGELVSSRILEEMPSDPYGGQWIISKDGRVFSTSKFAEQKNKK